MPTILRILGWRLFFYANEGSEPIHLHAIKGDVESKYWLDVDRYDISEAYAYRMKASDRREIRKIIFDHFDYIVGEWDEFQRRRQHGQGA
jgi:hypothetical protein